MLKKSLFVYRTHIRIITFLVTTDVMFIKKKNKEML